MVVNADARVRGFSRGDWVYSKDGVRFRASISPLAGEQLLDHEHVLPLAVEAAVAAVDADVEPAAGAHERDAGGVGGEDLADELVVAGARAPPARAPASARARRRRRGRRGRRRGSPRRRRRSSRAGRCRAPILAQPTTVAVALGDQHRRRGPRERRHLRLGRRPGLEGRHPVLDPLAVDRPPSPRRRAARPAGVRSPVTAGCRRARPRLPTISATTVTR